MLLDRIAEPACDTVDRAFEPRIGEGLDLPAVATNKVMVMLAVGRRRLVARDPVAGVHALDQAQLDERVEGAVDGRDADRTPGLPEPVEELLGAQTAVLAAQQLDHGTPGTGSYGAIAVR